MAPVRLRIAGRQRDDLGRPEVQVDITCVALITPDVVGDQANVIWTNGDDFYCVYGPTALDALRTAVAAVEDGTVATHFAKVARHYGLVLT